MKASFVIYDKTVWMVRVVRTLDPQGQVYPRVIKKRKEARRENHLDPGSM